MASKSFSLHPSLSKKIHLGNLSLCTLLLEDERHYPWLILVPRRPDLSTLIHLSRDDHGQLMEEIVQAQQVLLDLFQPTQINVAAIGNKTPQLHIHIIARFSHDPAWPQTVWDHPQRAPYPSEEREGAVCALRARFAELLGKNF